MDRFDAHYLKVKDSADKFAVAQFVVCPSDGTPSNQSFVAYPHNFYVFPRQELAGLGPSYEFLSQTTSIDFLMHAYMKANWKHVRSWDIQRGWRLVILNFSFHLWILVEYLIYPENNNVKRGRRLNSMCDGAKWRGPISRILKRLKTAASSYDAFMTGSVFAQLCSQLGVDFKLHSSSQHLAFNEKKSTSTFSILRSHGNTCAACYDTYKEICDSPASEALFPDKAKAVGIKWKPKMVEVEHKVARGSEEQENIPA
ncbi:hypothetical protein L6164_029518 [Bauhinia variegata]|uniref:Uncharacterized protein n=1 Tax=Bauhinia variegata TaxID=167791 RepID=A0ACB9L9M0_BAUVA|nr:hypothetical protein L6164_029518 [Bauhinia variegata]